MCFLAPAALVGYKAVGDLAPHRVAARSLLGIAVTCVSLIVMPLISRAKRRVGRALGSAAMNADAKQTEFCTYLSAIVLGGLVVNATFGLWWADAVAALIMVRIIAKEGSKDSRVAPAVIRAAACASDRHRELAATFVAAYGP